jgi:methylmalonyl-CoA/ethylmalonyl-CoA epimerase
MSALAISQIGQLAVTVQDLDRAVAFYRDVLGLPLLFQAPPGLAFFQCGAVRLLLSRSEGEPSGVAPVVYYKVDDLDAAYATLQGHQTHLIDEPHLIAQMADHELWMFFFYDSEGNMLALMQEKR